MESHRDIPWSRLLAEGAAIVVSILLAFWIDAWWDDRQQRGDEQIVLRSLVDDLRLKKEWLANQRRSQEVQFNSATQLLRAATDADHDLNEDSIDSLIGDIMFFSPEHSWDSAPMNALFMGGTSSLVSNVTLLEELAYLQVRINAVRAAYKQTENYYYNQLLPYLINNANVPQINMSIEHVPGRPKRPFVFPKSKISNPHDHKKLLSRSDFQGLLAAKIELYPQFFRPNYPIIDKQIDEVIVLLEEELAK